MCAFGLVLGFPMRSKAPWEDRAYVLPKEVLSLQRAACTQQVLSALTNQIPTPHWKPLPQLSSSFSFMLKKGLFFKEQNNPKYPQRFNSRFNLAAKWNISAWLFHDANLYGKIKQMSSFLSLLGSPDFTEADRLQMITRPSPGTHSSDQEINTARGSVACTTWRTRGCVEVRLIKEIWHMFPSLVMFFIFSAIASAV